MKANKRFILYITIVAVCLILAGSVIVKIVFRFQAQNEKLKLENKMYTLQFSTLYTLCGHTDTYDYPKQQAFTSLKEVQNYFPDWDVKRNTNSIHLSRTLKKETGFAFREFLNFYRLKKAKTILETHPEYRIIDVAMSCGFSDSNYFSKLFKETFKKSPTKIKKENKNGRE